MKKYRVTVEGNASDPRTYESASRNVLALAHEYGRAESGETLTVRDSKERIVSKAAWNSEERCYIRIGF